MYILKMFDEELCKFNMNDSIVNFEVEIVEIVNDQWKFPFEMRDAISNETLKRWLKRRTVPKNRAYVNNFLAKLGYNEKNTKAIIEVCKGLSLNDVYWVVEDNDKTLFKDVNLYENKFDDVIASIAFTGYGSYIRSSFVSSPELTTNGMLAKSWRRIENKVLLYKSGTEGAANLGKEPYSEKYAYEVAKAMGINCIEYNLAKWKGRLCSTCELFTSIEKSFLPISEIVRSGGINAVLDYYRSLGDNFYQEIIDMFVFDAIILNTDRHFGNFGVLIDNKTNEIVSPAPVFDNGLSLLCYAMEDDLEDVDKYIETLMPANYDNFIGFIVPLMSERQKRMVRHLFDFKFSRKGSYKLPNKRLKILEKVIQKRAREILDNCRETS